MTPDKRERNRLWRREARRRDRARNGQHKVNHIVRGGGPALAEIGDRLAEIPPDTRGLTGRVFGDPLPGRSALAQRAAP